jgi:two-component system cell cycle sensor histidine kinase/response regulator CckA
LPVTLLKILFVEDVPADTRLVHELLKEAAPARIALTHAQRLRDAVYYLRREAFNAILLDLSLPDSQGMETFDRTHAEAPEVPIVVLTGLRDEELGVKAVQQGAQDYLVKGQVDGHRLYHSIRYAIERRRVERRRAAQYAVTRMLAEAATLAHAAPSVLQAVCESLDWQIGVVWAVDAQSNVLRCLEVWREPDVQLGGFEQVTRRMFFSPGAGIPGHVWQSGKPMWHQDVSRLEPIRFPRAPDAAAVGLHSAVGFPIRSGVDTAGVIELFSREPREPDQDLLEMMAALGSQIGQFIERKRAEEALRASEEQFRLLLGSTAEGIYGLDLRGKCTFCNPAAVRLLGYAQTEDLLGKEIHALSHHTRPDGSPYPREECLIHQAFRRGEGTHVDDEVFWRADRTSFPVEYWSYPMRKRGEVVGAVVTFLDITERRRAEEALKESAARFRTLTEASFDGIAITEEGVVREANRGFAEMFGYTLEDVIGRPATEFVAEESRETVQRQIVEGIEGTYEHVGKRKDGRKILLEATAKAHTIGGRPGRITAFRDLTEKRLLEAQFRQAQKMEAVGRLAGGVAHDFNNLLTVIASCSELLLQDLEASDPHRQDLEEIRKAAMTAATLTHQLLAFSRQQVLESKVLNLNEIVTGAEKMLRRVIGEDVELVTTLALDAGRVRADAGQIEQVIMNLAVNARDAMPDGGSLIIETMNVELSDEYVREHFPVTPGRYVMLAFSDSGLGMDEPTKARIFEPFFTTKEAGKGTGLGLATVYGIVKQSGGFTWVYSEPGRGTTFKIYLPRVEEVAESVETGPRPEPGRGVETVLVVEDAAAVRAIARQVLERQGYTVVEAPDGQTALFLATRHHGPIHLLLTDVVMPGMSGRQLAERLKGVRPDLKIVYMSGYTDDAVMRLGVLERQVAYLQKPFTPEGLVRKVREVLDSSGDA